MKTSDGKSLSGLNFTFSITDDFSEIGSLTWEKMEKMKKFIYWGDGYWRGIDSLGRISQFYTWQMICKISEKLSRGKQ